MRSSISLANQEDAARATQEASDADTVYARDFAAIVEAMRVHLSHIERPEAWARRACQEIEHGDDALSAWQNYVTFRDLYGFPALLRALARAIELETGK